MVIGFILPKRTAPMELLVDRMCCEGLPAVKDFKQFLFRQRLHQQMNVIGHNNKIKQPIPIAIEMTQRLFND